MACSWAVLTEAWAWFLRDQADSIHHTAEQARRSALLVDAFGSSVEPAEAMDIRATLPQSVLRRADTAASMPYYSSSRPPGPARLCDVLLESAFWSEHLYRQAALVGLILAVIPFVVLAILIAAIGPFTSPVLNLLVARIVVAGLAVFVSIDQITEAAGWWRASRVATHTRSVLARSKAAVNQDMLAIFAEYAVGTASAHPIPEWIYQMKRSALTSAWKQRS